MYFTQRYTNTFIKLVIACFLLLMLLSISAFQTPNTSAQSSSCGNLSESEKTRCEAAVKKCRDDPANKANTAQLSQCIQRAQSGQASTTGTNAVFCAKKIQKDKCENEIKSCTTTKCTNRVARKYTTVVAACQNQDNPQNCQKLFQERCKGLSTADERSNCAKEVAEAQNAVNNISVDADRTVRDTCGGGGNAVELSIDFGCTGQGNPIIDLATAFIRFLSFGVGLVLVASIIFAGIQYTTSSGNPEQTAKAKKRIQDTILALVFYMFIFAIIQFLVPGGLFRGGV